VSRQFGFGVAAGLDPAVAAPLAARCEELGYASMWSNDHPGASGLETLAAFAEGARSIELGVAVIALDRSTRRSRSSAWTASASWSASEPDFRRSR
jgi:alkanesulfonate monooxygenase SsuD/methylene tetrahydromethanopterin reductase-like flavin-dependent oxidoreductase (luciferase family)